MRSTNTWIAAALWLAACGSSIEPAREEEDGSASGEESGDGEGDGEGQEVVIDASADESWAYFDLESGEVVQPVKAAQSVEWDLAFKRFHVAVNGGVSGSGGVEVAVIDPAELGDVREAPAAGYLTDVADGPDEDVEPDYAMSTGETGWWEYMPATHTLAPRKRVYVVRTAAGGVYKLAFVDYYNDAGSSGYPRIRFARLSAPLGEGEDDGDAEVDAGAAPGA